MGMGVSVRVIEPGVVPPPIIGWREWLEKYWPYLAIGGLGTGLVIAVTKKRKK
ncbi:hypothetical protein ES703_35180 [subsurface metagenome]